MGINYPKFDNKIQTQIDASKMRQNKIRPGVVMQFDKSTNMATVILDDPYSTQIGNIVSKVPCPSVMGIQNVSPQPGTRCLVGFRDENENHAYIISFFEEDNMSSNFLHNYAVNTGIPKYLSR